MCLWLLTACLGLLPANPAPSIVVVSGVPSPIILPTPAPTTTTTARPPMPGNMTGASPPPMTTVSSLPPTMMPPMTTVSSLPPTMMPPMTTASSLPPTMMPPMTTASSLPPTMMPPTTTASSVPPTMMPTAASTPPATMPPMTTASTAASMTMPSQPPPTTVAPTTASTTIGVMLLPLLICTDPEVVCIFNPDDNALGSLQIDPRLGTTPGFSAALIGPSITSYNAQMPSYDTAVKFPRERRSVDLQHDIYTKKLLQDVSRMDQVHKIVKRQTNCACVPMGICVRTTNGAGLIDVRIVTPPNQCPTGQEYCCGGTTPAPTPVACGKLQTVPATAVAATGGQANFGEFPWQALILTKQNDYIAGGVLVDNLNVLTVTHRLVSYVVSGTAPNVKVRLGEWDAAGTYEPVPYQEYTVAKVFTHPSFNANTLQYDITVLRLAAAVPFTPAMGAATTINRACLPPSSTTVYTGQRCLVSGWGKSMFGLQGQYQQILKKVDVPIVAPAVCQTQLQTARLGATYMLDTTSFICAGGEANKDSCTGDGGSGLVCQVAGSWVVVGLVSWGLGCAAANVPAAYVNVAALLPWIQQQIATP